MHREVFALLGASSALPSVMPSGGSVEEMKAKKAEKATPWVWTAFSNSARADGLALRHWQRKANVDNDYAFARFNRKVAIVRYSIEEYTLLVAPSDEGSGWTQDETNTLFDLADELDLRWYVIEDRWPLEKKRTLLDLKLRYYAVAKMIVLGRRSKKLNKAQQALQRHASAASGNPTEDATPSVNNTPGNTPGPAPTPPAQSGGDASGEADQGNGATSAGTATQRGGLETQTPPMTGVRDICGGPKSIAKVTAKAVALAENAVADLVVDRASEEKRLRHLDLLFSRTPEKEKEEAALVNEIRRIDMQLRRLQKDIPKRSKASVPTHSTLSQATAAFPPSLVDAILNEDPATSKTLFTEPGVYLRSARFGVTPSQVGIGPKLQEKMDAFLTEVGVAIRPVPTVNVCNAFDKLRQETLKLFALQAKLFDMKAELARLQGNPIPVRPGQKARKRKQSSGTPAPAPAPAISQSAGVQHHVGVSNVPLHPQSLQGAAGMQHRLSQGDGSQLGEKQMGLIPPVQLKRPATNKKKASSSKADGRKTKIEGNIGGPSGGVALDAVPAQTNSLKRKSTGGQAAGAPSTKKAAK